MLDITKPRDFQKMLENEEYTGFFAINGLIRAFKLPLNVYLDSHGKTRKYITEHCMDGTYFNYGEKGLYTDIPCAMIEIENYLYYVPISEDAHMLSDFPEKYNDDIKIILNFISKYHELFLLHWNQKIDDCDLCDFIVSKVITVEKNQSDFEMTKKSYNYIRRKLRKLKKHKKYNGEI